MEIVPHFYAKMRNLVGTNKNQLKKGNQQNTKLVHCDSWCGKVVTASREKLAVNSYLPKTKYASTMTKPLC